MLPPYRLRGSRFRYALLIAAWVLPVGWWARQVIAAWVAHPESPATTDFVVACVALSFAIWPVIFLRNVVRARTLWELSHEGIIVPPGVLVYWHEVGPVEPAKDWFDVQLRYRDPMATDRRLRTESRARLSPVLRITVKLLGVRAPALRIGGWITAHRRAELLAVVKRYQSTYATPPSASRTE